MARETRTDVLIVGGGVGGCAAAIAATALGKRVVLAEVTDWLGGQLSAQAVPPDEHHHVEQLPTGCTSRYQAFRREVRDYYRRHYPLTPEARRDPMLNPGECWVSRLCFEPRVAVAVLDQMMAPARSRGILDARMRRRATAVETDGDRVGAVSMCNLATGEEEVVYADFVLDATDLGDLLPLAGVEYVTGKESQDETGEPHAPGEAQPGNVQAFTWCFAMGYDPGGEHVIERPAQYDYWVAFVPELRPEWPGRLLDWTHPDPVTLEPVTDVLLPDEHPGDKYRSLWLYRRLICGDLYEPGARPPEVTLVNWPQNDYFGGNIIDQPSDVVGRHLEAARQLSLSLLYWLQTEAPRPDGGIGYPGLHLRPDLVGTEDGLAKQPYIRESRRIRAEYTIKEQDIISIDGDRTPVAFDDGVAIGCWHSIDVHPTTGGDNFLDRPTRPLQVTLGSLLPVRVENLLPAGKNIGVTHIANGCYRVHAIEWTVGEVTGLLAAYCLDRRLVPRHIRADAGLLEDFRALLASQGITREWPL